MRYNTPMQNRKTVFFFGLLIFLLPILGFPRGFESFLQILTGLIFMFMASRKSLERRFVREKKTRRKKDKNSVFVESGPYSGSSPISSTVSEISNASDETEDEMR